MPRAWLEALATEYLSVNRLHMQAEEKHFFPRALAALTDEDWAEIDERAVHVNDPIFGPRIEDSYLAIHERIRVFRL
jgi:hemerythrin-like domain-containing protein